ncbi:hypothetical protein PL8927_550004 [Planktothrix serta PCC 8927]|uniref:Uncharacterized protein n=1 Tax=Planktothrix serta PCC 8927 TaxID=671068 RepID=A0A7Z9E0F7_9CYAN|nr:hypothetical protein PL8927_550004 [Planktothrix serta PCC 8927]
MQVIGICGLKQSWEPATVDMIRFGVAPSTANPSIIQSRYECTTPS